MIAFLRAVLGVCAHDHRYRETRPDGLYLVCDTCDDAAPALLASAEESRKWAALKKRMARSKRWKSVKQPAPVVSIRRQG